MTEVQPAMQGDHSASPHFTAVSTGRFRRAGLRGRVRVTWTGSGLALDGDEGGQVSLPIGAIGRIRVGFVESKFQRYYRTLVWRNGESRPYPLHPLAPHDGGYAATVLEVAAALTELGRPQAVERGSSVPDALFIPALMGMLAIAMLAVAAFVLTDATWWQRAIVPALPVTLFAILLHLARTRHWPKPIEGTEELMRNLPH